MTQFCSHFVWHILIFYRADIKVQCTERCILVKKRIQRTNCWEPKHMKWSCNLITTEVKLIFLSHENQIILSLVYKYSMEYQDTNKTIIIVIIKSYISKYDLRQVPEEPYKNVSSIKTNLHDEIHVAFLCLNNKTKKLQ